MFSFRDQWGSAMIMNAPVNCTAFSNRRLEHLHRAATDGSVVAEQAPGERWLSHDYCSVCVLKEQEHYLLAS